MEKITMHHNTKEYFLIEACKRGEPTAEHDLYQLYAPTLFAICYRYMANKQDAEDILVEAFLKIFQQINTYSNKGSFVGWMNKIVVNECLMKIRAKKMTWVSLDSQADQFNLTESPLDHLSHEELLNMICELPEGYRIVFNLYAIEGYSHAEVAEVLGISENTSKSQLSRARRVLQEKIKKLQIYNHNERTF